MNDQNKRPDSNTTFTMTGVETSADRWLEVELKRLDNDRLRLEIERAKVDAKATRSARHQTMYEAMTQQVIGVGLPVLMQLYADWRATDQRWREAQNKTETKVPGAGAASDSPPS